MSLIDIAEMSYEAETVSLVQSALDIDDCERPSYGLLPLPVVSQVACFLRKSDLLELSRVDKRTCRAVLDPFVETWHSLSLLQANLSNVRQVCFVYA